jgi:hypothetical protein
MEQWKQGNKKQHHNKTPMIGKQILPAVEKWDWQNKHENGDHRCCHIGIT